MENLKLNSLLEGVEYSLERGNINIEINSIQYDSRKVKENDLFICIDGFNVDGHKYAQSAIKNGAVAIIAEKDINLLGDYTIIKVKNSRKVLAVAAANFYGNPSNKMKLLGITGTNGKTTSTYMIKSILEKAGFKVGLIGTIANYIGDRRIPSQRTTPESLELHTLFNEMVAEGVNYCIMEVSSHSLALDRVYGIRFTSGIFSNLTQDHLDFHKSFEEYFNAKYRLFQNSKYSIINIDDEYGKRIFNNIDNNRITYSVEHPSDVKAEHIYMHSTGIDFNIKYQGLSEKISLKIPGRYNVYNALCSAAVCFNEGINFDSVKEGLEKVLVPGRCEIVTHNYMLGYEIIIDYAHTPDGLENILKTVREFTKGRVISVFGCGGDRDKTKRPIMGKLGTELSDIAIITSDNPRSEEPNAIIDDIVMGISKNNYIIVENRRLAIEKAIDIAEKYDVIVIAGKGHEDYQELKDKVIHFDEREIIKEIIEKQKILGGE